MRRDCGAAGGGGGGAALRRGGGGEGLGGTRCRGWRREEWGRMDGWRRVGGVVERR